MVPAIYRKKGKERKISKSNAGARDVLKGDGFNSLSASLFATTNTNTTNTFAD